MRLGKPNENARIESFNGEFRAQHLSLEWFTSRLNSKMMIED
jgi:hypothetical protein